MHKHVAMMFVLVAAACGKGNDKGNEAAKTQPGATTTSAPASPTETGGNADVAQRKSCQLVSLAEMSEIVGQPVTYGEGGMRDDCEYVTKTEDATSLAVVKLKHEIGLLAAQREMSPDGDVTGLGDGANYLKAPGSGQMVVQKNGWSLLVNVATPVDEPTKDMRAVIDKIVAKALPKM